MGYEVKLVLTESYPTGYHGVIATLDLCKPDVTVIAAIDKGETNPTWGYYADDGSTLVQRDKYDQPIKAVNVDALLTAMAEEMPDYRRYKMAAALLTVARDTFGERLRVFAYGH